MILLQFSYQYCKYTVFPAKKNSVFALICSGHLHNDLTSLKKLIRPINLCTTRPCSLWHFMSRLFISLQLCIEMIDGVVIYLGGDFYEDTRQLTQIQQLALSSKILDMDPRGNILSK